MATATTIAHLVDHIGQTVTLRGWLYNSRSSGKLLFLVVRDGTGLCQCVLEKTDATAEIFAAARHLGQESSIEVDGEVRADERSVGGHELTVTAVRIMQDTTGYPITPKAHGIDFLMKNRHLWFRSQRQWAILRIRHTVVDAIRRYFNDRDFVLIDTPIFAPAAGEGAQTLFEVDYFGEPVYLAQTGQLYVEAAMMAHRKVYCFGPTFPGREEQDPPTPDRVLDGRARNCLRRPGRRHHAGRGLRLRDRAAGSARSASELRCSAARSRAWSGSRRPFPKITYSAAAELLHSDKVRQMLTDDLERAKARVAELTEAIASKEAERTGPGIKQWKADKLAQEILDAREELADQEDAVRNIPQHMELAANFEWGSDLGGSDETIIARLHDRPVFVTHYPRGTKAFYMKRNADDPRTANALDLLAPEGYGEIIGGSQREDDLDTLLERMKEEGCRRRTTSGTSTSAATAPSPTAASAWASSAP